MLRLLWAFAAAAGVMLAGGVLVALTWTENYGDNSERRSFGAQLHAAGHAIWRGACQGLRIGVIGPSRVVRAQGVHRAPVSWW